MIVFCTLDFAIVFFQREEEGEEEEAWKMHELEGILVTGQGESNQA